MGSNTKLNTISNLYRSLLVIENIKVEIYNQTVTLCNLVSRYRSMTLVIGKSSEL